MVFIGITLILKCTYLYLKGTWAKKCMSQNVVFEKNECKGLMTPFVKKKKLIYFLHSKYKCLLEF